jgi:hypothetical protein
MWSRHLLALGLSFCLSGPLWAQDFQSVIPSEDATFVEELGLYRFGDSLPKHFNILIVGQDNSTNRRKRDERFLLGFSRRHHHGALNQHPKWREPDFLDLSRQYPRWAVCAKAGLCSIGIAH